ESKSKSESESISKSESESKSKSESESISESESEVQYGSEYETHYHGASYTPEKETKTVSDDNVVKTGDNTDMTKDAVMAAMGLTGMAAVVGKKKKKSTND
ncbi:MAG TPA: hypothetical protein DIC33_05395, partial [Kandleria vitulina]|nr:hypothetical protein [Kandleria vitulina]